MKLLNVNEAASILSISPYTIRFLIRNGKLAPVRIGRRVLIQEEEVERFINEARSEARPKGKAGSPEPQRLFRPIVLDQTGTRV